MLALKFPEIFFRSAVLIVAAAATSSCGGGGGDAGNAPMTASAVPNNTPRNSPPSISWAVDERKIESQSNSGTVLLRTVTGWTTTGTMKVDFFVDGILAGTSTIGAKFPGVAVIEYDWNWNTALFEDGVHSVVARVTDNINRTAETLSLTVSVVNHVTMAPRLKLSEGYAAAGLQANGIGNVGVDLATGEVSGDVTLNDASATAAHIHDGYAGMWGEQLIALVRDGSNPNRWLIPPGSALTPQQLERLRRGALYLDVESVAYPDGELRAQLK